MPVALVAADRRRRILVCFDPPPRLCILFFCHLRAGFYDVCVRMVFRLFFQFAHIRACSLSLKSRNAPSQHEPQHRDSFWPARRR